MSSFLRTDGSGRQRRHFVGIQRPHEPRRDEHHQLGLLRAVGLALEQVPDDRQLAEKRNRRRVVLRQVVEQPGDRERLAVAQLDVGFGPARGQRRESGIPPSVMPLAKSSVLTSGRTFSRIMSPAIVGVKFSRMPNSLNIIVTALVGPEPPESGISPPARKLASWPL